MVRDGATNPHKSTLRGVGRSSSPPAGGCYSQDFFSLLWEPSFFQLLAEQTKLYARQRQVEKPNRKWYPTTSEEIKAFLGINIIMGIDQKPALTHYWSTDPYLGNQGIQSVMPRERFEALNRYLHLNDSEQMPGRDDPAYDPLYKISSIAMVAMVTELVVLTPAKQRVTL